MLAAAAVPRPPRSTGSRLHPRVLRARVSSAASEGSEAGGGRGRVVLRKWEKSAHCALGKDDPAGYADALVDFLKPGASEDATEVTANNIAPFVRATNGVGRIETIAREV